MDNSMKKNMLWNTCGNLSYIGCLWIVTIMVTIISGAVDAGILSVAMSASAILQTIALFGVRNFQVSDIDNKYSETTYFNFRTATSLLTLVICIVFSLISGYDSKQFLAILFYMLFRLAESVSDVIHGIAQKRGRLDIAGKSLAIKAVLLSVSFFGAYVPSGNLNLGLGLMALTSFLSTVFYDYLATRRIVKFSICENLFKSIPLLKEVYPLCLYMFLFSALTNMPKLVLEMLMGTAVLGIYSSIFAPATLLQAAAGYIYNPFATLLATHLKEKNYSAFRSLVLKISAIMLAVCAAAVLLSLVLGEFALVLIFGELVRDSVDLLIPIVIATTVLSYLAFFAMVATVIRDFRGIIIGCGIGFGVTIGCSFLFINLIGAQGTSLALIVGGIVAAAIILLSCALKFKKGKV